MSAPQRSAELLTLQVEFALLVDPDLNLEKNLGLGAPEGFTLHDSSLTVAEAGDEEAGTWVSGRAEYRGCPALNEVADWKALAAGALQGRQEEGRQIYAVEVHQATPAVNQEALAALAAEVAAALHAAWQQENRTRFAVRRKPTRDADWTEANLDAALVVRLTAAEARAFSDDRSAQGALADQHPALEGLAAGQAAVFEGPDGERLGVFVDIMASGYAELPRDWQEDNQAAAQGAAELIAAALVEHGQVDLEAVAAGIHEQWLQRNGERADEQLQRPFGKLDPVEQEKDRDIARLVLQRL